MGNSPNRSVVRGRERPETRSRRRRVEGQMVIRAEMEAWKRGGQKADGWATAQTKGGQGPSEAGDPDGENRAWLGFPE